MIGIYVRVSTQEQAVNGHSIDEQIERCTKYCDAMDWKIFKVYNDAGFSGGNTNRPALRELIRDINLIDKVLVYKLDRLSRSQKDTLYLIEDVFLKNHVDFVSMSENFDTSTSFGMAMIGILSCFAQLERSQIRERLMMGKEARAKQGYYSSSKSPIGYIYQNGNLITDEFEKAQVKYIFDAFIQGKSIKSIVKHLNDSGQLHKYGKWQDITVRSLLKSKIYLGYNKYSGEWYKATHEAFISEEKFDEAQILMEQRKEKNIKCGKANSYLGGLIYCKNCGAKYSKISHHLTVNGKTYNYNRYVCNSRSKKTPSLIKDPSCKNKSWKMEELDQMVFDEIRKLVFVPCEIEQEDNTEVIASEIEKIDDQISKLIDLYSVGQVPLDILQDKIKALNEKRSKLELYQPNKLSFEQAEELTQVFQEVLESGDFEYIRTILIELINKIEIDGEDITIYWNFE